MTDSAVERRPWPTDPRYLVGDDGTILGLSGRPLTGSPSKDGHLLMLGTSAHAIVCETFHGPRPPGMQAAHGNGNPADNHPSNLSWKTPVGNMADRHRHGTNGRKLTGQQVAEIRAGLARNETRNALAARYGVSPGMISHIKTGHSWRSGCTARRRTEHR